MNVFFGRTFIGSFDNTKWTEENGRIPYVDIGREHIDHYYEVKAAKEWLYGTTEVCSGRSDEGTLV